MNSFSATRRKLIKTTVAGGVLFSSPLTLSWASEPSLLTITSGIPEADMFLRGVKNKVGIDQKSISLDEVCSLYSELDNKSHCRVLGLLDNAGYVLIESYIHHRGGKLLFVARQGKQQVIEAVPGKQVPMNPGGSFSRLDPEHLGRQIAQVAIDQYPSASGRNFSFPGNSNSNSYVGFVAQI